MCDLQIIPVVVQEVDDKYMKMKSSLLSRQKHEAEAMYSLQRAEWALKLQVRLYVLALSCKSFFTFTASSAYRNWTTTSAHQPVWMKFTFQWLIFLTTSIYFLRDDDDKGVLIANKATFISGV